MQIFSEVHKEENCDGLSTEDFCYAISRSPDFSMYDLLQCSHTHRCSTISRWSQVLLFWFEWSESLYVMIKCWSSQWNLFLLDFLQNIWLQNMKNLRVSEWSHYSTSSSWFFFTRLYKSHWCMSYSKSVHINYLQIWSTVLLYFELHFNEPFYFKTIIMATGFASPLIEACEYTGSSLLS